MSPIEQALLDLMLDEITIEQRTGVTSYNDFTFGTPITGVRCQIVRSNKRTLDSTGREVTSEVQIILGRPDIHVTLEDRITLPDGSQPAIINIQAAKDDVGDYYEEIMA